MGVITRIFGRFAWLMFEGIARFYDEYMAKERDDAKRLEMMSLASEFFHLIGFVLPCVYCRISYRDFISTDIDINGMLGLKDGGKRLVYALHSRVTKKLWDQEREQYASDPTKLAEINCKWTDYSIPYERALKERFPSVESLRFWNAVIIFLSMTMCDYRVEDSSHIYRFFWVTGRILNQRRSGTRDNTFDLATAYARGLEMTLPLWKDDRIDKDLSLRIDIVWVLMNHVFSVKGWKFSRSRPSFEERCRASIVGCNQK